MMNRKQMIETIRQFPSIILRGEIDHQMSIDREYAYDEVCALLDTADLAPNRGDRKLLNACRDCLIAIGFYRPMSKGEIDSTWVNSGTRWAFKRNGAAYTADYHAFELFDGADV